LRWLEVKFKCFAQAGEGLFFRFALAGDINLKALGNVPVSFTPNASGKEALIASILPRCRMILTNRPKTSGS
jgi:hypothetical protein